MTPPSPVLPYLIIEDRMGDFFYVFQIPMLYLILIPALIRS